MEFMEVPDRIDELSQLVRVTTVAVERWGGASVQGTTIQGRGGQQATSCVVDWCWTTGKDTIPRGWGPLP